MKEVGQSGHIRQANGGKKPGAVSDVRADGNVNVTRFNSTGNSTETNLEFVDVGGTPVDPSKDYFQAV